MACVGTRCGGTRLPQCAPLPQAAPCSPLPARRFLTPCRVPFSPVLCPFLSCRSKKRWRTWTLTGSVQSTGRASTSGWPLLRGGRRRLALHSARSARPGAREGGRVVAERLACTMSPCTCYFECRALQLFTRKCSSAIDDNFVAVLSPCTGHRARAAASAAAAVEAASAAGGAAAATPRKRRRETTRSSLLAASECAAQAPACLPARPPAWPPSPPSAAPVLPSNQPTEPTAGGALSTVLSGTASGSRTTATTCLG